MTCDRDTPSEVCIADHSRTVAHTMVLRDMPPLRYRLLYPCDFTTDVPWWRPCWGCIKFWWAKQIERWRRRVHVCHKHGDGTCDAEEFTDRPGARYCCEECDCGR